MDEVAFTTNFVLPIGSSSFSQSNVRSSRSYEGVLRHPLNIQRRSPRASLSPLYNKKTVIVDPSTGEKSSSGISLTLASLTLPTGLVPPFDIETSRFAEAFLVYPQSYTSAIIFAHGLSQEPRNTQTLLCTLAASGKLVLAPRTWLLDVIGPWVHVETQDWRSSPPARWQTALLIDTMRCVNVAKSLALEYEIYGHSTGAGLALVAGWWLRQETVKGLRSVACLAPAIEYCKETELNPVIAMGNEDGEVRLEAMAREFPDVPILILHGTEDSRLASSIDIKTLFEAFGNFKREAYTIWGDIENGTHVGFQDKLDVAITNPFRNIRLWLLQKFLFLMINMFYYGERGDRGKINRAQLKVTKQILLGWMQQVQSGADFSEVKLKMKQAAWPGPVMSWNWASGLPRTINPTVEPSSTNSVTVDIHNSKE